MREGEGAGRGTAEVVLVLFANTTRKGGRRGVRRRQGPWAGGTRWQSSGMATGGEEAAAHSAAEAVRVQRGSPHGAGPEQRQRSGREETGGGARGAAADRTGARTGARGRSPAPPASLGIISSDAPAKTLDVIPGAKGSCLPRQTALHGRTRVFGSRTSPCRAAAASSPGAGHSPHSRRADPPRPPRPGLPRASCLALSEPRVPPRALAHTVPSAGRSGLRPGSQRPTPPARTASPRGRPPRLPPARALRPREGHRSSAPRARGSEGPPGTTP